MRFQSIQHSHLAQAPPLTPTADCRSFAYRFIERSPFLSNCTHTHNVNTPLTNSLSLSLSFYPSIRSLKSNKPRAHGKHALTYSHTVITSVSKRLDALKVMQRAGSKHNNNNSTELTMQADNEFDQQQQQLADQVSGAKCYQR